MAILSDTRNARTGLTDEERAELCRRVDFAALLERDGIRLKQAGNHFVCSLRPEDKTASCHVWPPNEGKYGEKGWTFHDYGTGEHGDALTYLIERHGLEFLAAVSKLASLTGFVPPCVAGRGEQPPTPSQLIQRPPVPTTPKVEVMALAEQSKAVAEWLGVVEEITAELGRNGGDTGRCYVEQRKIRQPLKGVTLTLTVEAANEVAAVIAEVPEAAQQFADAGLYYTAGAGDIPFKAAGKPRGDVALFVCHAADGLPAYILARRLDWAAGDERKYLNQPTAGGRVQLLPFGLPALYLLAGAYKPNANVTPFQWNAGDWKPTRPELLIVEGVLDALAAAQFGWAALATLTRPSLSVGERLLKQHLSTLRRVEAVWIIPDADGGEKGEEGEAEADKLSAWLNAHAVKAKTVTLKKLGCPPEAKDLADWAAAISTTTI